MKTFKEIMNEETDNILYGEDLDVEVIKAWKSVFPNSYISSGKTAMNESKYNIYQCSLGKDKSEYPNEIFQNDPLRLMFSISISESGYVVEYKSSSLTIKPDSSYKAYSSLKLKGRKTKAKTTKELIKKLTSFFKKIHESVKGAIDDGSLDIHGANIVKMIKSKL